MVVRLTKCFRDRINRKVRDYAFADRRAAIAAEKPDLFRRVMEDIYGAETVAQICELPTHWFDPQCHAYLNLDGWNYNLSVSEDAAIPVPARRPNEDRRCSTVSVKDPALVADLRDHATREDELRAEDKKMSFALASLLMSCATVETFLRVMPEAREWIGDVATIPVESTALVVSGGEIARLVRVARVKEGAS